MIANKKSRFQMNELLLQTKRIESSYQFMSSCLKSHRIVKYKGLQMSKLTSHQDRNFNPCGNTREAINWKKMMSASCDRILGLMTDNGLAEI